MQDKNIIGKQLIDVVYDGGVDPFAFRDEVSWFCTSKLIPAIEKIFERYSVVDMAICFEILSIDVGELPAENWQDALVERVVEELCQYLGSTSVSQQERGTTSVDGLKMASQSQEIYRREIAVEINRREILFYFLKHGTLPWNSTIKNRSDLNSLLLELVNDEQGLRKVVHVVRGSEPVFLRRLICQFEDGILDQIILRYAKIEQGVLSQLKKLVEQVLRGGIHAREIVYTVMFSMVADDKFKTASDSMDLVMANALQQARFVNWVRELSTLKRVSTTIQEVILSELDISFEASVMKHIEKLIAVRIEDILSQEKEILPLARNSDHPPKPFKEVISYEGSWFVNNAGLVILHPFLPMLFENVGYTENKKWLSTDTQYRAIMLMQFMVKGDGEYAEFDLTLNKILAGYPQEDTLPADLALSDFEKQEGMDVLTSVIKHWTALKNTSVVGLQSEFLQREAKLFIDSDSWNLKVEQKTSDVLMNRLPWGISMIKNPWMKAMMQVEWI